MSTCSRDDHVYAVILRMDNGDGVGSVFGKVKGFRPENVSLFDVAS